MTGPVLLAAAWPPELQRWRAALARRPGLGRLAVGRAVGVGLVEAAIGATRAIAEERPRAVVFVGTAGVYPAARRRLPVGGAVCIGQVLLLCPAVLRGDAYLPAPLPAAAATDPRLRAALARAGGLPGGDLLCPLGITSAAAAARRAQQSGALENLEAFAVARAAAAAALPFAAVVGVSNVVGPDAHRQWRAAAAGAAAAACDAVIAWLTEQEPVRAPTRRRPRPAGGRPPAPAGRGRRSPA